MLANQTGVNGFWKPLPVRRAGVRPSRGATLAPRAVPEMASMLSLLSHVPFLDPEAAARSIAEHMPMGLEMVVPQCKAMKCGDAIYRETLDPVLRMEERGIDPKIIPIILLLLGYGSLRPGPLAGFIDTYITAPLRRAEERVYSKDDFIMGRKLATGGFGTVFRGQMVDPDSGDKTEVILKKAKEFGEAEVWMNERCMRACPDSVAEYLTAFDETGRIGDPLWLVWKYEGDFTLYDLMQKKEFPYNAEPLLFGRELNMEKGPRRRLVTYKTIMRQLLQNLDALHANGLVHRDVKPQNMIISESAQKVKFIDLGACADLRVGINYVPSEYLMDPRFAPPQQYIMSTTTPRAPPAPLAALLSPVLWRLNGPDRFDMYSAGMVFLQMVFPNYRPDNGIFAFNKKFGEAKYDLRRWRNLKEIRDRAPKDAALKEAFEVLDADGGAGWDLLQGLLAYEPFDRLSAADALGHPFVEAPERIAVTAPEKLAQTAGTALVRATSATRAVASTMSTVTSDWLTVSGKGKDDYKGLTEALLENELQDSYQVEVKRTGSATMAFWKQRQVELDSKLKERRSRMAPIAQTIRGVKGSAPLKAAPAKKAAAPAVRGKSGPYANGNGNGNGAAAKKKAAAPVTVELRLPSGLELPSGALEALEKIKLPWGR